ncbi:carboxypeptidase regulatory-like domain-containing protein [Paenibacillus thalictri]|uniref:carboxypeptidase regulatory-like domain-containing protein n=1 Tax=Paenibacillus thalictri TaxID=2527873 RepID=UPI0013EF0B16|nr:carboxypeptidase regulatory-like domain-containing protein [Paenibacillus thalictri]
MRKNEISLLLAVLLLASLFVGFPQNGYAVAGTGEPASSHAMQETSSAASAEIVPYPVLPGAAASTSYTVKVNGQDVFTEQFGDVSYARFSYSGTVQVDVYAGETIQSFGISPLHDEIEGVKDGNRLTFSLSEPKALIITVNDLERLLLFADGLETEAPVIGAPGVVNLASYMPADRDSDTAVTALFQQAIDDTSALDSGAGGILVVPDGKYMTAQLKLKSNVHLYLQSGAWIRAVPEFNSINYPTQNNGDSSFIFIGDAQHVKITGRGFIDGNGMAVRTLNPDANIKLLRTADASDLLIRDVYFRDSARWSLHLLYASDVTLTNIKLINDLRGGLDPVNPELLRPTVTNTDGVDIDASQNVTVEGNFIYTGDDAISPKVSNYMNLQRPTFGLNIKNNVLWSLKVAMRVGDESLADMYDINFENNDVIRADRFLTIWAGDAVRLHDINVINNRAEFIGGNYNERYFQFVIQKKRAAINPGWIDRVLVKDFTGLNKAEQPSSIEGFDAWHLITNVTFDNVKIAGITAANKADMPLRFVNRYYNNVAFLPSGTAYSGSSLTPYTYPDPSLITSVEAEDMELVHYTVEDQPIASGGKVIKVTGTGTADQLFDRNTGIYDVIVHYFDENDGNASYKLFVNGSQVDAWIANQDLGSASVSDNSRTTRLIPGVLLKQWDEVRIEGTSQASEAARIDKIEYVFKTEPDWSGTGGIAGTVTDDLGSPVSGASVQTTVSGAVYRTFTDAAGAYLLQHVPAGTYAVKAAKSGYSESTASAIPVSVGSTMYNVNFLMPVVSTIPHLAALQVSGSIPALAAGQSGYDLNKLIVTARDQFGGAYPISGLPLSWHVQSGAVYAAVYGSMLQPLSTGTGAVTATINGVESNTVSFAVYPWQGSTPRILSVDRRGLTSGAYLSIAAAVNSSPALKPGDRIQLVPGSGPYRETVSIHASGTPGNPIVFEGNGELVTGFNTFQFTQEANGQWTYTLPAPIENTTTGGNSNTFRHLVTYNGQRLMLDQRSGQNAGQFTSDYAVLSADGKKLVLNASKSSPTEGWEISVRQNGIAVASPYAYQTYRNVRVSGAQNDGFNIHGTGKGLVFENIEGFHNFDEGYSAHDSTESSIDGGVFWGNDNGIYNQTSAALQFTAINVEAHSNIGAGFTSQAGNNYLNNVRVWDNGVSNVRLGGTVATVNVVTYESRWNTRPWVGFQELQNYSLGVQLKPYTYSVYAPITYTGMAPTVVPASQLPPMRVPFDDWRYIYFTAAQLADPAISGPTADPDHDGLTNYTEYVTGQDPNH